MVRSATFVIPEPRGRMTTVARVLTPHSNNSPSPATLLCLCSLGGKSKYRDLILDRIMAAFFRAASGEQPERMNLDDHFERIVRAVNDEIVRQVSEHGKLWLTELQLALAIVRPPDLVLTLRGAIRPLLAQHHRIYNLLDLGNHVNEGAPNPFRFLATLTAGRIEDGAVLTFLSESVLDYLSLDRIRRAVTSGSMNDAVNLLRQFLPKGGTQAFAGIILKIEPDPAAQMSIPPINTNLEHSPSMRPASRPILATPTADAASRGNQVLPLLSHAASPFRTQKKVLRIWWQDMGSRRGRIAGGLAVVCLLLFLESVVLIGKSGEYRMRHEAYIVLRQNIENAIITAEASLAAGDLAETRTQLATISDQLITLSTADRYQFHQRITGDLAQAAELEDKKQTDINAKKK